jgi:hypothetical protein
MHLKWGTVGEGKKGMGRKGGSIYSQPGIRVDGDSHHDIEEGFPSKGRGPRNKGRDFQATKGDYQKDWGMHFHVYVYHANCVYIVLIKDCV